VTFLELLGVVGTLAGVGAALDFATKDSIKHGLGNWLLRVTASNSKYGYNGTAFLDRIFGKGLLSASASLRYMAISFASICVSYGIAYITTPSSPDGGIILFPEAPTFLSVTMLGVCVLFATIGDIASYSITRVFIRTVDSYQTRIVAVGLVVADIITSLSLFFLSFSFARITCVVLALLFSHEATRIENGQQILQEAVATGLRSFNVQSTLSDSGATAIAIKIAHAEDEKELEAIGSAYRKIEFPSSKVGNKYTFVKFPTTRECVKLPSSYLDVVQGRKNALDLMVRVAQEQNSQRVTKITQNEIDELGKTFSEVENSSSNCSHHIITITRSMSAGGLIAAAGPINAYLAAAEETLFDAYSIIGFKLAPYVYFDPYEEMNRYTLSLRHQVENTFLGIAQPDAQKVQVFGFVPESSEQAKGRVRIPFSPMAASSLTSSIFFLGYLATLGVALVWRRISMGIQLLAPKFDLDKAVFTSIGIAFSAVVAGIQILSYLLPLAWDFAFNV